MKKNFPKDLFVKSWATDDGINKTPDILDWISGLNDKIFVDIQKTTLDAVGWFYSRDEGQIVNATGSFFSISGFRQTKGSQVFEQPIILQNEIGYLGIICKVIDGSLHFLMQAKIEPGNVNKIQISPTIQATKSNFTQRHGGAKPAFLEYFLDSPPQNIVVDQIQSEQSSRFLKKRNRNIIVFTDENVEEGIYHKWMTLGQLKALMKIDNLVNMDTRTVLSCIPAYKYDFGLFDTPFARSVSQGEQPDILPSIFNYVNNHKMFGDNVKSSLVPLYSLKDWETVTDGKTEEFVCKNEFPFKIIFCDISIEGREVRRWGQPLLQARGMAVFGIFVRVSDGIMEFLIHAKEEIGCFDKIELGPAIRMEAFGKQELTFIEELFFKRCNEKSGILHDVVLSEEGGRFYHEQNRNVVIEIEPEIIDEPPPGYWWCTYRTLSQLVQFNNILNIQLRNLLSLMEVI